MRADDLAALLAWEGGYIRWRQCCYLIGLDPDNGGLRELLTIRRNLLATVLSVEPLPPSDGTAPRLESQPALCRQQPCFD